VDNAHSLHNPTTPVTADVLSVRGAMRSQGAQDEYLWENVFKDKPYLGTGFFVEFGARDGVEHSNSHFYEKVLGWRGILAEPDPLEHRNITTNRPCSAIFDGAFCGSRGYHEFSIDLHGWGGFKESYDTERLGPFEQQAQKSIRVACMTLDEILPLFGVFHVNFLSADTEGSEQLILERFPFDKVTVDVISVEVLRGTPERARKQENLIVFMESKRFEILGEYQFTNDTSDFFFVPTHPITPKVPTYDIEKFENSLASCKLLGRCL
jgi:FkbM family methyltransferase